MSPSPDPSVVLRAALLPAVLAAAVALPLTACGTSGPSAVPPAATSPAATGPAATGPAPGASDPVREGADPSGTVSRGAAEATALAAVGEGRVTWSGPEDDRGAAWEVEITRPDGSEVDVLVAADGTVVKQIEKFGSGPATSGPGTPPAGGTVVSLQEAERAALAAVGEGRVTWSGREDERGAAWEIEITRPDGSEIDVLVAADGSIVN